MSAEDAQAAQARRRVGELLKGKWRLERLLGIGGMAAVYEAVHRNGKRVAVKMLHPHVAAHEDIRARFLREGYVANRVSHPGAVSVLDDDVADDGAVFLVMELLEGETLNSRAARSGGKLDLATVLALADRLLDVLAAAHAQGIVHRDLKPENVFLTREGQLKVLDFGIARLRDASSSAHATSTGVSMGTPAYMAPEQARGRWTLVDAQTDLWAVGATMFVLLTGRDVHEAATLNELLLAAMTNPAPPLASLVAIPADVAGVVDRALAFEKSARWADARAMQIAVRAAMQRISQVGPPGSAHASGAYGHTVTAPSAPGAVPPHATPHSHPGATLAATIADPPSGTNTIAGLVQGQTGAALSTALPVRKSSGAVPVLIGGITIAAALAVGAFFWITSTPDGSFPRDPEATADPASAAATAPAEGAGTRPDVASPAPPQPSPPASSAPPAPTSAATASAAKTASASTATPRPTAPRPRPTAAPKPTSAVPDLDRRD
jgi:serine/threonine-protein kinase